MDIVKVSSGDDGSNEVEPQSCRLPAVSDQCIKNKNDITSKATVSVTKNDQSSNVSVGEMRVSARLQKIPVNKRPYYGSVPKTKSLHLKKEETCEKKAKLTHHLRPKSLSNIVGNSNVVPEDSVGIGCGDSRNVGLDDDDDEEKRRASSSSSAEVVHVYKVKKTLRTFTKAYLRYVQVEEKRCRKVKKIDSNDSKTKSHFRGENFFGSKTKNGDVCDTIVKRSSRRPDLKAISEMLEKKEVLYSEKRFGQLPGIDVGSQFFSRAEMVAVGLHGHTLKGIDYIGTSSKKLAEDHKGYTFPLVVAIVLSGQYEDDMDHSEDVIYTGEGGNDLLGKKCQVKDQVMDRGNLALKNNLEQSVPVRVIRGHKSANSYCGKVYTYDGLYTIVENWAEKGVSGYTVYKYRLRRVKGQPILLTNQVPFAREHANKVSSESRGVVCADICQGQEDVCISVTNVIDDPPLAPKGFTYSKGLKVSENIKLPPNAPGCKCKDICTNPTTCSCAKLNCPEAPDFPYVGKDGGRLIEAQDVVYECGPNCGCGPSCVNRTSQRGLKYHLEVFRTEDKGWAVRSWDYIPSGAPICEYTGVVKRSDELDNVTENEYIFDIDCYQTIQGIGGRERRLRDVFLPTSNHLARLDDKGSETEPEFCIDAGSTGNVARFINHSCEPNLFAQCVLSSHHDIKLARVVLFAGDNIPPLQELTYDYCYELGSVIGPDGKVKELPCHCGAACCRKRLY